MRDMHGTFPILSCAAAQAFETDYFAGDTEREWLAMKAAALAVANAVLRDFEEVGGFPSRPQARVLVLAGKGHNAGDALLAAGELRSRYPALRIEVLFALGEQNLRPLAQRAWLALESAPGANPVTKITKSTLDNTFATAGKSPRDKTDANVYDLVFDGVFGFQFRPPLPPALGELFARVNAMPVLLRAAVDLHSGLDAIDAFRADFTYATGSVKTPLLTLPHPGRIRFLDLGFPLADVPSDNRVASAEVLDELRGFRSPESDKRTYGHVLIVAGSRRYPGAALMATLAALHGGAGLVTAAVPESLVPAFAARVPEAMWVGLPETPEGGLALEGLPFVRAAFARATSVVIGPGLGRERETLAFAADIARACPCPIVIDADALQPEIVAAGTATRVLTPHAGELPRIEAAIPPGAVVVKKGPITRIVQSTGADVAHPAAAAVYHSFFGGPVLARGGSGDLLAGLTGARLAQLPRDPLRAAVQAVVWHGVAADALARANGAAAVRTTQLLDFLAVALRNGAAGP